MSRFGNVRGPAHREDWGTAVEVEDGLFRIRLNNPVAPLMVNSYAYRGAGELLVIDPGWPWTLDAMEQSLRDLGLARSFIDVDAWLYTHTHIDHMGAAALLADITDAPHYASVLMEPFAERWHSFQDRFNDWVPWTRQAFDTTDFADRIDRSTRRRRAAGVEFLLEAHGERGLRNVVGLDFGEEFSVADLCLRFVDGRGHGPYHGAFYEPDRRWLFSGDVVIATPTPISRAMEDDLSLYLASLDRLETLDAKLLLPGHGVQRSGDLSTAFSRSRGYQDHYRQKVLEVLTAADEPLGLMEIGLRATPDGTPFESQDRWLVHLALLDSHLHLLRTEELVEADDRPRWVLC